MKWHLTLLILSLPCVVQAKVTSATLFPSHAQVVWEESAALEQGSHELRLEGLPVSLQDETLMAEVQGVTGVMIQQVQIQRVEQAEVVAEATRRLRDELEAIEHNIGAREDQIQAWNQQIRLMSEAAGTPGEVTAPELSQLATTVQESTLKALSRIREIRQSMTEDLAERDRIKRELAAAQQETRATKQILIVYQADNEGQAKVRLQYQTRDASWRSQYNARLTTDRPDQEGTLALEHLAMVRQNTGTDWSGIDLSLSTANAHAGNDIPPLFPWIVAPGPIPESRVKASGMTMDMMRAEVVSEPQTAELTNDGTFTQRYRIESPVSLVSGNADQSLVVARYEMPASIETRFFPAMSLNGFVHATATFEAGSALPGGPVTLYRDGQSVGRSYIESLSSGAELTMGFGVNDRVVAEVVNEQNQSGEQGIFKGEKYVRMVNRYEITNNHPQAVAVRVFDRIPVSQQDNLTVEELDITEPVERNAEDIKGVLSWQRTIKPGQAITLKTGFEVRVPEDSQLPPEFR